MLITILNSASYPCQHWFSRWVQVSPEPCTLYTKQLHVVAVLQVYIILDHHYHVLPFVFCCKYTWQTCKLLMFLSFSLGTRVSGSYGRNLGRFARPGRSLGMPGAHRSPARSPDWWSPYVPPLGLSATGALASELLPWMGWSHAPLIFDAFAMVQSSNQQSESANQDIYPISVALPKIRGMFTIPTWVVYLWHCFTHITQLLRRNKTSKSPTLRSLESVGISWSTCSTSEETSDCSESAEWHRLWAGESIGVVATHGCWKSMETSNVMGFYMERMWKVRGISWDLMDYRWL